MLRQFKALAWQVDGADHLAPVEAHAIYERNVRHLNEADMGITNKPYKLLLAKRQIMFKCPHHQRISHVLAVLDGHVLAQPILVWWWHLH